MIRRSRACFSLDEASLGCRVRQRQKTTARETTGQIQRQGPPAASQVEDVLAVLDARSFDVQFQHPSFGIVETHHTIVPVATAVLQMLSQHLLEERSRKLVVLFVGALRCDCNRALAQVAHELLQTGSRLDATRRGFFFTQSLCHTSADTQTNDCIREEVAIENPLHTTHEVSSRGNQGKKALVVFW